MVFDPYFVPMAFVVMGFCAYLYRYQVYSLPLSMP